ncbi:hypothetical protein ABZZ20_09935 [Streptomyces sp. NPDC006430]|uniref:hypothetical protein n=1 Tax=Streptomyces sp. NPDC006430 TaxID=3154299 RepID=UPI0033B814DE
MTRAPNGLSCAHRAACPVVVVPLARPPVRDPYGQVVLGLNTTVPDDSATSFGFREAARRGFRLRVVAAHPGTRPARVATPTRPQRSGPTCARTRSVSPTYGSNC